MKQVIRCLSCRVVTSRYKSYRVHLVEDVTNALTAEIKQQGLNGYLCGNCASDAGYKVSQKNLMRTKKIQ